MVLRYVPTLPKALRYTGNPNVYTNSLLLSDMHTVTAVAPMWDPPGVLQGASRDLTAK